MDLGLRRTTCPYTFPGCAPLRKGVYDEPAERRAQLLDAVAAQLWASPGQVALAWLAAQRSPRVIPLIGSTRVERYREASEAMRLELTEDQLLSLDTA